MKPGEFKQVLKQYRGAVFFIKKVAPGVIARHQATAKELAGEFQEVFKIVSQLESLAFYDGHYLAFGLAAGSCRHTFCWQQENCQALEGKRCRFSLLARPSMEAVGIDVYKMVAAQGWDIQPVGTGAQAENMDHGVLAGIVIVQ